MQFKFHNTEDTPVIIDNEAPEVTDVQHGNKLDLPRTYTGPSVVHQKKLQPVKQFKTMLGNVPFKSIGFTMHGKNVISRTALTKALEDAKKELDRKKSGDDGDK